MARLSAEARERLEGAERKVRGLEEQVKAARGAERQRGEMAARLASAEEERSRLRAVAKQCEVKDGESECAALLRKAPRRP